MINLLWSEKEIFVEQSRQKAKILKEYVKSMDLNLLLAEK